MRIAFLGLGLMGSAIARHLVKTGYEVTVWNRSENATRPLVEMGATAAPSPREAVADAQIIFTMVHDDRALESILLESGALDAMQRGATHVSLATISVALARRLTTEHAARGQGYVASPVFGRPNIAAEGKLWLAVAGAEPVLTEVLPVLSVFSRGQTVVGDVPAQAHAVKLGGNFLITAMIASLSEAFTVSEAAGIEPAIFLETVNSALFQSPFYASYGKVMLNPPEQVAATVDLGIKDAHLFLEAAKEVSVPAPLAAAFQKELQAASDAGLGEDDWAAGYLKQVRSRNAHGDTR